MTTNPDIADAASQGRGGPGATGLVTRARNGDQQAWDALVERYAPLIWSICRHYRLDRADAEDVGQSIWLQFVNYLGAIRDPGRGPWLAEPPRPDGNAAASCVRPADRRRPGNCRMRVSPTSGPRQPSRSCWRRSATRRCARH